MTTTAVVVKITAPTGSASLDWPAFGFDQLASCEVILVDGIVAFEPPLDSMGWDSDVVVVDESMEGLGFDGVFVRIASDRFGVAAPRSASAVPGGTLNPT